NLDHASPPHLQLVGGSRLSGREAPTAARTKMVHMIAGGGRASPAQPAEGGRITAHAVSA
ncbi:hypothetical protein, partial [Microbacterium esteraromaticum]|uniref:hypothetical protein n=1 Tax=Microbacterium esteraromaticum TaxID=57043 RepID=UPI001C4FE1AA